MGHDSSMGTALRVVFLGAAATGGAFVAQPGFAAEANVSEQAGQGISDQAGQGSSEIVVTARRREESLQEVPVAITAKTGEGLRDAGIRNPVDLQAIVPSLSMAVSPGGRDQLFYTIRGQRGDSKTVAVYFNDIYAADNNGSNIPFYDMASLQVLKGPQGTLFGATSTGGAVLYTFNSPSDEFTFEGGASIGNFNLRSLDAAINVPIAEGAALRISGNMRRRQGYTRILAGGRADGEGVDAVRMQLRLNPVDGLESRFLFDSYKWNQTGDSSVLLGVADCGQLSTTNAPLRVACPGFYPTLPAVLAAQKARGIDVLDLDDLGRFRASSMLVSNTTTYRMTETLSIKNIVGFRKVKRQTDLDDGMPFRVLENTLQPAINLGDNTFTGAGGVSNSHTLTDELQLQGEGLWGGRLDFTVGGYYERLKFLPHPAGISSTATFLGATAAGGGVVRLSQSTSTNLTRALFGHVEMDLSDLAQGLGLAGGYRYNWRREQERRFTSVQFVPAFNLTSCLTGTVATGCTSNLKDFREEGQAWDISVNWKIDRGAMVYLAHRKGYRAGSIQDTQGNIPAALQRLQPEQVKDFELGGKIDRDVLGRPATLNAAVYRQQYSNIQRNAGSRCLLGDVFVACGTTGANIVQISVNAAKARIIGAEVEAAFQPLEGVNLSAFYAYTDAKFTSYNSALLSQDLTGLRFANVPLHSVGAAAAFQYELSPTVGTLHGQATWNWRSSSFSTDKNSQVGFIPSYSTINLRAGVRNLGNLPIDLSLFVDNLTNERPIVGVIDIRDSAGVDYGRFTSPRFTGVELRVRFGGDAD